MIQRAPRPIRTPFRTATTAMVMLAASLFGSFGLSQQASRVTAQSNADGVLFSEDGQPILQFQAKPKSREGQFRRANYVHPLFDSNGNEITEDFPEDHLHQRGIYWAWHQVKIGEKVAGDSWLAEDFEWLVSDNPVIQAHENGAVSLATGTEWRSPAILNDQGTPTTFVQEKTAITVWPNTKGVRFIDFDIKLIAALPNVSIAGSDDEKGYGGFSLRVKQPADLCFLSGSGEVEPVREQMEVGNWIDMTGSFGEASSGMAIFVHPSSSGFPQKWILRGPDVKSMQNPVFPGRAPVQLSESESLNLRYRIVLHEALLDVEKLNELYDQYQEMD